MQNDPIYSRITSVPRPTPFAASALILLAAVGLWLSALLDLALPEMGPALSNAAYYLPFVLLPLALCARRQPGLGEAMRLKPLSLSSALGAALLGLLSVYVASLLTAAWEDGLSLLGLRGAVAGIQVETEGELAVAILSVAALPAVCEELLFRGFAMAAWEGRGTRYAACVCAALFALLHGSLFGMPAYLLVGAVSAFIVFASDSLYGSIVYHTVYNAACLILPWLLRDSEAAGGEVTLTVGALLSLALEAFMMLCMMALLLVVMRLKARNAGIDPISRIRRPLEGRDRGMLWALLAELAVSMVIVTALSARAAGGGL